MTVVWANIEMYGKKLNHFFKDVKKKHKTNIISKTLFNDGNVSNK